MTDEQTMGVSRRGMLSGLGTGAVAATSGCLTTLPSFGQRVRYGAVDEPTPGEPVYGDWLPPGSGTSVRHHVPGQRGEETLGGPVEDRYISSGLEYVGVTFDEVEYVTRLGERFVMVGDVDQGRVRDQLDRNGYSSIDEYSGFERYEREHRPGATSASVVVDDDAVLYSGGSIEELEPIIDAKTGGTPRAGERSETVKRQLETLGAHPVTTFGYTVEDETSRGLAAGGTQYAFDDESAYAIRTEIYLDPDDISRSDIEAEIESHPDARDATRVDLRIEDRVVTIAVELEHDTFVEHFGPLVDYPLAAWDASYDETEREVTLTYLGGDQTDPASFELINSETDEPVDGQFAEQYESLSAGATVTVLLGNRDELRLHVEYIDTERTERQGLFGFTAPESFVQGD